MSDYIQDPALLDKLSKPVEVKKDEYVSDPAVLEKIQAAPSGDQKPAKEYSATEAATMIATPAASLAYGIESGYSPEAVQKVTAPLKKAIPQTFQTYMREPLKAAVDVMTPMVTGGIVPPPYATTEGAKGLYNAYGAAKESISAGSKIASQFADVKDLSNAYHPMRQAIAQAAPGVEAKISEIFRTGGGNQGVKTWLTTTEEGKQFLNNPATKGLVEQYIGAVPSKLAQAGKILKPIAVTAGRVAGPVGLAYDIYEASPYLEQAQVGQNTASGQVNQMMQAAKQAQLNAPTPAPLTPQEATNLLQSGDQRTIDIYGGAAALQQIATGQSVNVMTQPPNAMNFLGRVKELSKRYKGVGT